MQSASTTRGAYQRGEEARGRIQAIIEEWERAGKGGPTLDELVAETGLTKTPVRYHIAVLTEAGIVHVQEPRREIRLVRKDVPL